MKRDSFNKLEEKAHLRRFIDCFSGLPEGEADFTTDEPDLIIRGKFGSLGIEHTRIYRSVPSSEVAMKALESLEQKIIDKAREAYEKVHTEPASVAVLFNLHTNLSTEKILLLATTIAEVVATSMPRVGVDIFIENPLIFPKWLPLEISGIFVNHLARGSKSLWDVGRGGGVPDLTSNMIEERISKKEFLLEKYRANGCTEVWLLLVIDGFAPSSNFCLPEDISNKVFRSQFDQVFLFRNFTREIVTLSTKR
jgi:hypothetical protein